MTIIAADRTVMIADGRGRLGPELEGEHWQKIFEVPGVGLIGVAGNTNWTQKVVEFAAYGRPLPAAARRPDQASALILGRRSLAMWLGGMPLPMEVRPPAFIGSGAGVAERFHQLGIRPLRRAVELTCEVMPCCGGAITERTLEELAC